MKNLTKPCPHVSWNTEIVHDKLRDHLSKVIYMQPCFSLLLIGKQEGRDKLKKKLLSKDKLELEDLKTFGPVHIGKKKMYIM